MKVVKTGLCKKTAKKIVKDYRAAYVAAVGPAQGRALSAARGRGRKSVAAASGFKLKTIKGRISGSRYKPASKGMYDPRVYFWYHWAFLPAEAVGRPRQTRRGVRSGKMTISDAFIIDSKKGRRAGKQTLVKRVGDQRLPLERQGYEPSKMEQYDQAFKKGVQRGYLQTYDKRFAHEYKRQLTKRGLA